MGLNILFWNCQGIRPKRKELELYLKENVIDIRALNEMFLNKELNFHISGYDTIRNDHSAGPRPLHGRVSLINMQKLHFLAFCQNCRTYIPQILYNTKTDNFTSGVDNCAS